MTDVLVSGAGSVSTSLGPAATGQAEQVKAGKWGRNGKGAVVPVAVDGSNKARTGWEGFTQGFLEAQVKALPTGSGEGVGFMFGSNGWSQWYTMLIRNWGDVVIDRTDTALTAPNQWASGDSNWRQSTGVAVVAGDTVRLTIAPAGFTVTVNGGAPVAWSVNGKPIGSTVTDPNPLTGNVVGLASLGLTGQLNGLTGYDALAAQHRSVVLTDYVAITDKTTATNTTAGGHVGPSKITMRLGGRWVTVGGH